MGSLERLCCHESRWNQANDEDSTIRSSRRGKFGNSRSNRGSPDPPGISDFVLCYVGWWALEGTHLALHIHWSNFVPVNVAGDWSAWLVLPVSVGLQVPGCRQTSFAQEDATSSFCASNVVLSYGVALTPRHRDFLHLSLCWKKEPGEKSLCMLPLGKG